jgi:nucleotide-binding universal stress UspA family protein
MAETLGAELDVVHIWDRPRYVPEDTIVHMPQGEKRSLGELVKERAEGEMVEFLATVPGLSLDRPPAHRLLSGDPASTLIAELEKGAHDLIVIGTHGRTGFRRLVMGSVAETVVRLSPVAVMTIPGKHEG